MQCFRIVIENVFGEVTTYWHTLQLETNKRIGKQDIGRMFPKLLCFLAQPLNNLAGNLTSAMFGQDLIEKVTLVNYLAAVQ